MSPLEVTCPFCRAAVGDNCKDRDGRRVKLARTHLGRVRRVRAAVEAGVEVPADYWEVL